MRSLLSFLLYVAWCGAVVVVIETAPHAITRLLGLLSAVVLVVLMWRSWRARQRARVDSEQVLSVGEQP